MKERILITGISGFIGKNLSSIINNENYDILVSKREASVIPKKNSDCFKIIDWDLEKENIMEDKIDILVHIAAEKKNEDKMWLVNFLGTKNLVKASIRAGVKKIIFLSTVSIYEKKSNQIIDETSSKYPSNSYEVSKLAAENFIRESCINNNINFTIIRPTNVIGLEKNSFLGLIKSINEGYFTYFGDYKKTKTNYVTVEDLCLCIIYFIKNKYNNDFIINDSVELYLIINTISKTLKVESPKFCLPKFFGFSISTLCNLSQKLIQYEIPFNSNRYNELTNLTVFSSEKLNNDTNFYHKQSILNKVEELTTYYLKNNFL